MYFSVDHNVVEVKYLSRSIFLWKKKQIISRWIKEYGNVGAFWQFDPGDTL